MKKKEVLVLVFSNLIHDARVRRQVDFLKEEYQVTIACYEAPLNHGYDVLKLPSFRLTLSRKAVLSVALLLGMFRIAYKLLYPYEKFLKEKLKGRSFDIIIANDVETLPLAFAAADMNTIKSKVFFDAHEFAPRHFEDRLYWRIFFQRFNMYLCRTFIPLVHGMSTVNKSLADAYHASFRVMPIVITNASEFYDTKPKMHTDYPIRMVHHGIFNSSRQPQLMLNLMKSLDERFTLDLIYMIPPNASKKTRSRFEEFKREAERIGRIRILPPLKSSEIVTALHKQYDIGVILIPPVNFNYENTLPNKLFDFIQARIAIAGGPLKEISRIVEEYNIGIISKDHSAEELAKVISRVTPDSVNSFKANTERAAEEMNASFNKQKFLSSLRSMF
jgi:hypothetical protein